MGRRRRSAFDDIVEIASKCSWKVALALALLSLVILHGVAAFTATPPVARNTADFGPIVIVGFIHAGAVLLQFVFPPAFVLGAIIPFMKQRKASALFAELREGTGKNVHSLSWQEFESLVAEGFRRRGFDVTTKGGTTPDGGIDIVLAKGHDKYLVQCKQWRARQVGVTIVRELYGVMAAQDAAGGYVVTSGRFTRDAIEFATGRHVELIDGEGLKGLVRESAEKPSSIGGAAKIDPFLAPAPLCPRCQTPMVSRVAKQGANAGATFWGCRRFPECRGLLPKAA